MKVIGILVTSFFLFSQQCLAKIPKEISEAFSRQIKYELDGAYTYLAMSQRMAELSYDGASFWFMQQFYEELNHARIMMDFVEMQQGNVTFPGVNPEHQSQQDGLVDVFREGLVLEETQTSRIKELKRLCQSMDVVEAENFLRWFISEQVEEEDMFGDWLDKLERVAEDPNGMLRLDDMLGQRPVAVVWQVGQPLP